MYPTHNTESAITHILDYASTNTTAVVQFKASDTVLHIDSDASYLFKPRACICTVGSYYIISQPSEPTKSTNLPPLLNELTQK